MDSTDEQIAALEDENQQLRERVEDLAEAVETNTDSRKTLARRIAELNGRLTDTDERLDTHDDALRSHGRQIEQLNDAPGKSAGVAKVAKIREAIVRRATRKGSTTVAQAAQMDPVAMDYTEILALFDYDIDRSYASQLISKAACDESDDHEAFWEDKTGNKKLLKLDLSELPGESPYRPRSADVTTDSRDGGTRESVTTRYSEGGS